MAPSPSNLSAQPKARPDDYIIRNYTIFMSGSELWIRRVLKLALISLADASSPFASS